jgi:hypothetical protein
MSRRRLSRCAIEPADSGVVRKPPRRKKITTQVWGRVTTCHTRTPLTLNRPHLASVQLYSPNWHLILERNQLHERGIVRWRESPELHCLQGETHCCSSNMIRVRTKPAGCDGCLPSPTGTPQTHLLPVVCPVVYLLVALYGYSPVLPLGPPA